jgi:hypothetical protein
MLAPGRAVTSRLLSLAVSRVYAIGVRVGPSPLALAPPARDPSPVLEPSSISDAVATGVADPFMLRVDGSWHMFFEVVRWGRRGKKGEIGHATSPDGLRWKYDRVVLAEPFHLSYPHVFQAGSDVYMVPESHQAGAVRLYRGSPFPQRWAFVATLVEGADLVDSSLFEAGGRWWMLTGVGAGRNDTLRLFHARDLRGPFAEHPRSPIVKGDPDRARPAGRVVSVDGRLLRFAQGCGAAYGTSVRAFEITRLGPTAYEEVATGPDPLLRGSGHGWNRSGMHHLDAHRLDDGRWLACVDGWAATR